MQDVGKVTDSSMQGEQERELMSQKKWESVQQINTGWTVPGSNSGKGKVSLPE